MVSSRAWSNGRILFVFGEVIALAPCTARNTDPAFDEQCNRDPNVRFYRRLGDRCSRQDTSWLCLALLMMHADAGPFYQRQKRFEAARTCLATHIFHPSYVLHGRADKSHQARSTPYVHRR